MQNTLTSVKRINSNKYYMDTTITENTGKMNPIKFTLWVAIGSICMMFAALTSAYIVKKNQGNFLEFDFPMLFTISTGIILNRKPPLGA